MATAYLHTAPTPGAVGIIQLVGSKPELAALLTRLTGRSTWVSDRLYLIPFADIDSGLACIADGKSPDTADAPAWLMPHGGPRVIERLLDWLTANDCPLQLAADASLIYPEASTPVEADALTMISKAASPAAVDLLLQQPQRWREWLALPADQRSTVRAAAIEQAGAMARLVTPPTILVMGQPNVGKSTLTNRMLGRSASVVADLPGTTRDWVGAVAELGPAHEAVAVQWIDTPGLRHSDDAIEQRASTLARELLTTAAVVIALRSPDIGWPDVAGLPRTPDLWAVNKIDRSIDKGSEGTGLSAESPLHISAQTGNGLALFERAVLRQLGLDDLSAFNLWAFNDRLAKIDSAASEDASLSRYITGVDKGSVPNA